MISIKENLILEVGHVYVMTNEEVPGILKIGMTTRSPEERATELSSTGVPGRWNVSYSIFVPNCEKIEKKVHKALDEFRLSEDREFFRLEVSLAIEKIDFHAQKFIDYFPGWPNLDSVNIFIQNELARIKDKNSKRVQQIRLEKQAWLVGIQQSEIEEKIRASEEEQSRKRIALETIDKETRKDINKVRSGWFEFIGVFFGFYLCVYAYFEDHRLKIFFWAYLFFFFIFSWFRRDEMHTAIKTRKDKQLPEV